MTLRWFLWSLLSPSQLLAFALLAGVGLLLLGRLRAARIVLCISGACLFLFGLLPTSIYLGNLLETRFPQPDLPSHVSGIILLAGAERRGASQAYGTPQLGPHGGRYVSVLTLAKRFPRAPIVFTGDPRVVAGMGPLETQAAVAQRLFADVGLDASRVVWEEGSPDTCASGRRTYELLRPGSGERWIVVTSAMHMPRTVACFRAAGWGDSTLIAYPADYRTVWGTPEVESFRIARNLMLFDEAMHEWLGLVFYRLTGRTNEWFPVP